MVSTWSVEMISSGACGFCSGAKGSCVKLPRLRLALRELSELRLRRDMMGLLCVKQTGLRGDCAMRNDPGPGFFTRDRKSPVFCRSWYSFHIDLMPAFSTRPGHTVARFAARQGAADPIFQPRIARQGDKHRNLRNRAQYAVRWRDRSRPR